MHSISSFARSSRGLSVAITGAGGFLGKTTVAKLLKTPGVSLVKAQYSANNQLPHPHERLSVVQGDLTLSHIVDLLLKDVDVVLHLGERGHPTAVPTTNFQEQEGNVQVADNILRAMLKHGATKIVFASSGGAIYRNAGEDNLPFSESSPVETRSTYAVSKLQIEAKFRAFAQTSDIGVHLLRMSSVYGPDQLRACNYPGFVSVAVRNAVLQIPTSIWGSQATIKDFIYIDDVVAAFAYFLLTPAAPSGIFNVGSGVGHSFAAILQCLHAQLGYHPTITTAPPRSGDAPWTVLDIAKISRLTTWHPQTSLEQGLRHMIAAQRNSRSSGSRHCSVGVDL